MDLEKLKQQAEELKTTAEKISTLDDLSNLLNDITSLLEQSEESIINLTLTETNKTENDGDNN